MQPKTTKPKTRATPKPKPTKQDREQSSEGRSLTLYDLESELTDAMANWLEADDRVSAGDESASPDAVGYMENLRHLVYLYLEAARDKRDKVARFILHLDNQEDFAAQEIQRLQRKQRAIRNARDRLKDYVAAVCESQGVTKLEGQHHVLSLRKCPDSIEITDEGLLPKRHLVPQPPKPDKRGILEEYQLREKVRQNKLAKNPDAEVELPSIPGSIWHRGKNTVVIR